MDATSKGIEMLKSEIRHEVRGLFKMNMKFEEWSVPEANSKDAALKIFQTMQDALDELKREIESGEFHNY